MPSQQTFDDEMRIGLKEIRQEFVTPQMVLSIGYTAGDFAHLYCRRYVLTTKKE